MAKRRRCAQCLFTQPTDSGPCTFKLDVAWIPEEHARVGHWIKIDGKEGDWQVQEVWTKRWEDEVIAGERDYKNQRGESDVPKGGREPISA